MHPPAPTWCDLKRDDRNNSIIAIDDDHLVAGHEVALTAPLREGRRDRNDKHRRRHHRAHADGEVDVAGPWSRLSDFGALLRSQRSAAAARLSLLSLALLRGLTLRTLAWLWTLALLLGLAGALSLVLLLARLHLIFLTLLRLALLRGLTLRTLAWRWTLAWLWTLALLRGLTLRTLAWLWTLALLLGLAGALSLARLHLIFLTLLRLSRRAAGRTRTLGGRA